MIAVNQVTGKSADSSRTTIAHPSHKSKKALNRSITAIQGSAKDGAEGEIRTRTTVGHYPLKIACLPVPPLRHKFFYLSVTTGLLEPPLVRLAVQESLQPVRE